MPTPRRLSAIAAVLAVLAGCSFDLDTDDDPRPLVLTTFTVTADIARQVAGDDIRVESILKPGSEVHGYEPTPRDIGRASQADLILDNGYGLEAWFEQFVERDDAEHVVLTRDVEPIDIASDAYAGKPNPHAWMSPLNVQRYVDVIVEAFTVLVPERAAAFAERGAAYAAELQAVHDELTTALADLPADHRALVTCEGAFSYLARDAGLTERYIWPVNAEQQSTPQRVAGVIEFVDDHDVPAVFCESTVSDRSMRRIVEATDARFGGTLYVDSLSAADGPVPTYLELVRHDVDLIVAGLTGASR